MTEELLNVYDALGRVVGKERRRVAKSSGRAVGAVNILLLNGRREVLLQQRPDDKENGGLWDKSVGGHVSAGEEFDETAVREAQEELFDEKGAPQVVLAPDEAAFARLVTTLDLSRHLVFRRLGLQLNLRDVRHASARRGVRNVLYHLAIYGGRSEIAREGFSPQEDEIVDLRWTAPADVDRLLLEGRLAPNMAFLWLAYGAQVLAL